MRLQIVGLPDALHRTVRHADRGGEIAGTPRVTPSPGACRVLATTCARMRAELVGGRPERGVDWIVTFTAAAFNLIRLRTLLARPA